jgi:hypothetical protein
MRYFKLWLDLCWMSRARAYFTFCMANGWFNTNSRNASLSPSVPLRRKREGERERTRSREVLRVSEQLYFYLLQMYISISLSVASNNTHQRSCNSWFISLQDKFLLIVLHFHFFNRSCLWLWRSLLTESKIKTFWVKKNVTTIWTQRNETLFFCGDIRIKVKKLRQTCSPSGSQGLSSGRSCWSSVFSIP